ncbi:MAG TPA: hypothetical protein VG817_10115 [Gemmatimonadales bacterium]|nr:hypothetical protein [Gemmatimonadales bacterium]
MIGARMNEAPTAFGAGTQPPTEFLVYGQSVAKALPCNTHDVCYQTVGTIRSTCDKAFYEAMRAVCTKAYPPVPEAQLLLYPVYRSEQTQCFNKATLYYNAVVAAGLPRFNKRQGQHTYSNP